MISTKQRCELIDKKMEFGVNFSLKQEGSKTTIQGGQTGGQIGGQIGGQMAGTNQINKAPVRGFEYDKRN